MSKKTQTKEVASEANEENKVEVPIDFLETLKADIANLKKDRDMLLSVADKKSLSLFYQRNQKDLPKEIGIREINGKVIIGWRTLTNEVFEEAPRKWVERQDVEILYQDGSKDQMRMVDFNRLYKKIMCRRVGVIKDEASGQTAFKLVRLDTGEEMTIADTFVN
jgi:hypothetical protein